MDACCFIDCDELNKFTHMSTNDRFGQHWFCEYHWTLVSYVFKDIKTCIRNSRGCIRNHKAEIYEYEKTLNTIKFQDKYWDLCDRHIGIYDEITGIDIIFGDYD